MATKRGSRNNDAPWESRQIVLCWLGAGVLAFAGGYAIATGLDSAELCLAMLVGSVFALGAYDTRHDQPTQYNLLRSWPFGSAADDHARGKRTVASQALHILVYLSVCLCVCRILLATGGCAPNRR